MKKTTFLKTFLVAVGLLMGTSAWADPIETIGSLSSGWWTDFSSTYTLENYGKYHFQFTTTNANDGESYKTWLLVATDGDYPSSYTGKGGSHTGTEYFVWRGDSYAWGQTKNSNGNPTLLACSNTYSGSNMQAAMNGASVDMVITRVSHNIYATATVTPTNGDSEFTMSFSYLFGNATSANIGLFLTVQNAQVVLNTAEQTKEYTRRFYQDFEDAETFKDGWTINSDLNPVQGTCTATGGTKTLYMKNGSGGGRAFSTDYTSNDLFTDAEDYIYEFDFNYGACNAYATASTLTVLSDNAAGKIFTVDKASVAWSSEFNISNAAGTALLAENLPGGPGYNTTEYPLLYHFTVEGIKDDGVYLTVTNGSTTNLARTKVADFGAVTGLSSNMGKNNTAVAFDNVSLKTYSEAEVVTDPTIGAPVYAGANRTVSITSGISSKGNTVHTYYTLDGTDPTELSTEYTTAVTITENCTLKAITISTTGESSSVVSRAITVGKLTLNAPTYTKTAYSAGNYTVEITSNQSDLDYVPASPAIKYSIDGGSEETYSSAIAVPAGSTVAAHVEADGYNNSSTEELETGIQPNLPVNWTQNYVGKVTGDITLYEDGEGYHNCVVSAAGDNYYVYSSDGTSASTNANAGFQVYDGGSPRKWMIRESTGGGGMYNFTAGNAGVAIANLTVGQIVKVEWTISGYGGFTHNSGVTKLDNISYGSVGYYEVTADGIAYFTAARNAYVKNITVYNVTVSATVGAKGYSTLTSDYSLNFTGKSIKAYIVKSTDGSALTLTQVNKVVKNTPLLLYSATNSDSQDIPVIADSEATDDLTGNKLVAGDGAAHTWTANTNEHYVLYTGGATPGFYQALNSNVAVGKAYLDLTGLSATARSFDLNLGDDVTGISEKVTVNSEKFATATYNLNGQRVAQPTKGLYIVNGKKVVIK